jgi:polysaccharide biosynthesis/export protein
MTQQVLAAVCGLSCAWAAAQTTLGVAAPQAGAVPTATLSAPAAAAAVPSLAGTAPAAPQSATAPAAIDNVSSPATESGTNPEARPEARPEAKDTPQRPDSDRNLPSDFQRFVQENTGKLLPVYGANLFRGHSFGPVQGVQVPDNYLLGPGDEIVIRVSGVVELADRLVIGRDGQVVVPRVGPVPVAGIPFSELHATLNRALSRVLVNYTLSVNLGRLRSIEVFVVGEAQAPGRKVVSSLSTLVNALFETGGPSPQGSMRAIELRRSGKTIAVVDLYRFVAKGDTTGDQPLLPGDVIYIPPVGPQVALVGTVHREAIYELTEQQRTIEQVLALTGGLPVLAAPQKAQLDRVDSQKMPARFVEDFSLDAAGLAKPLRAGDVLTIFQISPQLANAVTLQGHVASPMRYNFVPGMRVSDLVANNNFLVPVNYWLRVNAGINAEAYSQPEVNLDYATIQRLDPESLRTEIIAFNLSKALLGDPKENLMLQPGDLVRVYGPTDPGPDTLHSITLSGEVVNGTRRFVWRPGMSLIDLIPSSEWLVQRYNYWQRPSGKSLQNDINWDFAQVVRRVPEDLRTRTFPIDLRQAVLLRNPAHNIPLEPGDNITLFTTAEVPVPVAKRTQLVTLAGEVAVPGVYQILPGETLPQLIRRVGGLTPQAYVFGLEFTRETVRLKQQQNLDQLIARLEASMQSQSLAQIANLRGEDAARATALQEAQQASQRSQLARLKTLRSNGRVALEMGASDTTLAALPPVPLEDGDRIVVPTVPSFVAAFGAVNNENVFIFRPGRTVGDVFRLAGLAADAEVSEAFVLRADGTVVAQRDRSTWFNSLESVRLMPGDTVVVPQKVDRESRWNLILRNTKDITQILSNLGLGLAALRSL